MEPAPASRLAASGRGLSAEAQRRLAALLETGGADASPELQEAGWTGGGSALVSDAAMLLGVDVGGTKVHTVLADLEGEILAETRAATARGGGDAVLDQIAAQRAEVLERAAAPAAHLAAAGIGVPGAVHPGSGRLHRAPNVPGFEGRDLRAALAERLGLPVAIENDVNLAALGEHWRGGGAGADSLVFIALGTGIGMGSVIGGRLLRGAAGAAGEIAWLPIGGDPYDPAVQASGALESVISSAAVGRAYREAGGTGEGTLRELFEREGDATFEAVLDRLADLVARAILAVVAVLDPERVVLGGSVGARAEVLERVTARLAQASAHPPDCRVSRLGARAGVVGAVRAARMAFARSLTASAAASPPARASGSGG